MTVRPAHKAFHHARRSGRGVVTATRAAACVIACAFMLSGCAVPLPAQRFAPSGHVRYRDLPYGTLSDSQSLDLYVPRSGHGPYPLIVYIHGGGYVAGDKSRELPQLQREADARGYAVASIDYRLLSEARFPAQVEDAKAAVEWLRKHARRYDLDPDRFAVWGVSAGGQLAMMVGMTGDNGPLTVTGGGAYAGDKVQAVIDWYGPADFSAIERYDESRQMGGWNLPILDDAADQITAQPRLEAEADPATEADPADPPVFIAHGDADVVVPVGQSVELARQLRRRIGGDKVRLVIVHGAGHRQLQVGTPKVMDETFAWLDAQLAR